MRVCYCVYYIYPFDTNDFRTTVNTTVANCVTALSPVEVTVFTVVTVVFTVVFTAENNALLRIKK